MFRSRKKELQIGDIFNRRVVSSYLALFFPDKTFTMDDVELAYYIMSILIRKASHIESMENDRVDFCHDDDGDNGEPRYLTICYDETGKRNHVQLMLKSTIFVPCYGLRLQNEYSLDLFTCDLPQNIPRYYLIELLEDKKKLRIFFDFWRTIPDYRTVFTILHEELYLPADIANMIILMVAKGYG